MIDVIGFITANKTADLILNVVIAWESKGSAEYHFFDEMLGMLPGREPLGESLS